MDASSGGSGETVQVGRVILAIDADVCDTSKYQNLLAHILIFRNFLRGF